jgi:DNA polymerase-3 subunit gamma/tau
LSGKTIEVEDAWSAKPLHRAERFSDFIGQDTVIDILRGQEKSGKFSKSYIITGEMGDGKSSLGRIIAKKINDTKEDNHPNIRIFKATVQSGIDDVRALLESLKYAPIRDGKVVIIIEEAHGLTGKSADALLVDLENPPKHVVFILITNEPHKIKATLINRCKKLELRPLKAEHIKELLLRAAKKEEVFQSSKYNDMFDTLSRVFEGRNRDAINALSNLADISKSRKISKEDIASVVKQVSGIEYNDIVKFMIYMYNKEPNKAFALLNGVTDYNGFTHVLLDLNTYLLKHKTGLNPPFHYGGKALVRAISGKSSVKVDTVNSIQRILIDVRREVTQVSAVQPEAILLYYATKLGEI